MPLDLASKRSMATMPGRILVLAALTLLILPAFTGAATINVGVLSFDTLIPGEPGLPGVNGFSISNLTLDPAAGGFALPPDFPVYTNLVFMNARLSVLRLGEALPTEILLGNIGPGSDSPLGAQFPDVGQFASAIFSGELNTTMVVFGDGSVFQLRSGTVMGELLPANGQLLEPGTDLIVLSVDGDPAEIPEPTTVSLIGLSGIVLVLARRCQS